MISISDARPAQFTFVWEKLTLCVLFYTVTYVYTHKWHFLLPLNNNKIHAKIFDCSQAQHSPSFILFSSIHRISPVHVANLLIWHTCLTISLKRKHTMIMLCLGIQYIFIFICPQKPFKLFTYTPFQWFGHTFSFNVFSLFLLKILVSHYWHWN